MPRYTSMPSLIDLTGQRFGRWTVLKKAPPRQSGIGAFWVCKCDCGNTKEVLGASLKKGDTKSCGCYRKELVSKAMSAHKYPYPRLRTIWRNMIDRCENQNATSYPLYGAVGIDVCKEWKNLDTFVEWALSNGYADDLTIDRVDGTKGYCPNNCRWVSKIQQQNNKRNNHLLTVDGKTDTIANWARYSGLSHSIISARIKMGWSDERAVLTPKGAYKCKKYA